MIKPPTSLSFQLKQPVIDVTKVYSLQEQLQNLILEIEKDEEGIRDEETKRALQTTREMIQALVNNVDKTLKAEEREK